MFRLRKWVNVGGTLTPVEFVQCRTTAPFYPDPTPWQGPIDEDTFTEPPYEGQTVFSVKRVYFIGDCNPPVIIVGGPGGLKISGTGTVSAVDASEVNRCLTTVEEGPTYRIWTDPDNGSGFLTWNPSLSQYGGAVLFNPSGGITYGVTWKCVSGGMDLHIVGGVGTDFHAIFVQRFDSPLLWHYFELGGIPGGFPRSDYYIGEMVGGLKVNGSGVTNDTIVVTGSGGLKVNGSSLPIPTYLEVSSGGLAVNGSGVVEFDPNPDAAFVLPVFPL